MAATAASTSAARRAASRSTALARAEEKDPSSVSVDRCSSGRAPYCRASATSDASSSGTTPPSSVMP